MTQILVDRATIEQALEALEYYRSGEDYQPTPASNAITALKAALAQEQAEPVCERVMTITTVPITVPRVLTDADLDAIRALLPEQAEPAQEPLVWESVARDLPALTQREYDALHKDLRWNYKKITPPQRPPLTDEDMRTLADKHLSCQPESYEVSGVFELARAIERKVRGEKE